MIITKQNFNLTPGYRGKWPFNVSSVSISAFLDGQNNRSFILLHNWVNYALSGSMERYGLPKLEEAGIWQDVSDNKQGMQDLKKSLTPFFSYLNFKFEAINQGAVGIG